MPAVPTTSASPSPAWRTSRREARPAGARAAAVLFTAGTALGVLTALLHPHHEDPNNHAQVFTEYAVSHTWQWVHDLQYLAGATVAAGFVALYHALTQHRPPDLLARLGLAGASITTALIGLNMAVDGVALRHAVQAWVNAAPLQRPERFAAAEAIRWLEWGANSLFLLQFGATVALFAICLARQVRRLSVPATAGLGAAVLLIVNGYQVGAIGFVASPLPLLAAALFLVMSWGVFRLPSVAIQQPAASLSEGAGAAVRPA
ncbi:MAG TPA: hypothetical protein VFP34_14110 [Microlunatus sp.]|nr:hypothetical protein [Microlunatus sp.]